MKEKLIRESIRQAIKEIGGLPLPKDQMEPEERPTTPGKGNVDEKMLSEDEYLFEGRKQELHERLMERFIPKKKKG